MTNNTRKGILNTIPKRPLFRTIEDIDSDIFSFQLNSREFDTPQPAQRRPPRTKGEVSRRISAFSPTYLQEPRKASLDSGTTRSSSSFAPSSLSSEFSLIAVDRVDSRGRSSSVCQRGRCSQGRITPPRASSQNYSIDRMLASSPYIQPNFTGSSYRQKSGQHLREIHDEPVYYDERTLLERHLKAKPPKHNITELRKTRPTKPSKNIQQKNRQTSNRKSSSASTSSSSSSSTSDRSSSTTSSTSDSYPSSSSTLRNSYQRRRDRTHVIAETNGRHLHKNKNSGGYQNHSRMWESHENKRCSSRQWGKMPRDQSGHIYHQRINRNKPISFKIEIVTSPKPSEINETHTSGEKHSISTSRYINHNADCKESFVCKRCGLSKPPKK